MAMAALQRLGASASAAALLLLDPAAALRWGAAETRPDMSSLLNSMGPMCYNFDAPQGVKECRMGSQEACPMTSLRGAASALVYPGGKTRCLSNDKPDYAFQVFPGDTDKLYILFDGGGAAWDQLSTAVGAANKSAVTPIVESGFLRRGDERNPFSRHTIIVVQYCSGDLHAGDKVQSYRDSHNKPVVQAGYHNTMSAVDWALANMQPTLKSLAVSGVSAGSIAAEVWSFKLLRTFKYESARIWADSYVPIFPPHFQGKVFKHLGVCDHDLLEGEWLDKCNRRSLNIEDVFDAAIKAHPQVGFASVTSTHDWGQTLYFKLTALTDLKMEEFVTFDGDHFHRRACKMFQRYHEHPNFVSFMMESNIHIFQLCDDAFTYAIEADGVAGKSKVFFADWVKQFMDGSGASAVRSAASLGRGPGTCDKEVLSKKTLKLTS
mmetsp:Transcript_97279/g.302937  ORF Transcript_97279/g.302937 Transcript_97279/m.302937 type:complete len:435 (+) Transcript_97279:79-1383(+)